MINLVLADDHAVFVDALRTVLTQRGFEVSAVAGTVALLLQRVQATRPDVCVVDRHFTDGDAIDHIAAVVGTGVKVVVLTADGDGDTVLRALDSGATGYVHKSCGVAALAAAIHRVALGEVVVDLPSPVRPKRSPAAADAFRLATYLTKRERECLTMLVEGLGTAAMTRRLGVSATTVRTHVQSLLTKLGVHSRLEAASLAVRHGLLNADLFGRSG